jgi:hypothetical protein
VFGKDTDSESESETRPTVTLAAAGAAAGPGIMVWRLTRDCDGVGSRAGPGGWRRPPRAVGTQAGNLKARAAAAASPGSNPNNCLI